MVTKQELAVPEPKAQIVQMDETRTIEIKNLVVSPMPRLDVALGTSDSFIRMTKETPMVQGVIWNERCISLMTNDRSTSIMFAPELRPEAAMFFEHHDKRTRDEDKMRIWEGDYAPVQFTKRDLVKFLSKYSAVIDGAKETIDAVKKMSVKEMLQQNDEMLELDSNNQRTVIEETVTSNIPKSFKMRMNLAENFTGELHFQVEIARKKDRYDQPTKDFCLVLRCTNAREVMQNMMQLIVNQLPQEIPRYYGAVQLYEGKKGGSW